VSRALKIAIAVLVVLVVFGMITLTSLRQAITRLSGPPRTEEQARREVMQVPISTPTDVKVRAQLYWLSAGSATALEPAAVELPLSANPVERSKQLLAALIADVPTAEQRTLPEDATLLAFYLQSDGTAIADFSDELSTKTPSGILSEQVALDSLVQTLGANVNGIQRLKILVHGQEADTLAGHIDLSGFFPVPQAISDTAPSAPPLVPSTPAVSDKAQPKPSAPPASSTPAKQPKH
jgi:hypothetical protein